MPGIVWHAAPPYREIAFTPRSGSPPVSSAASLRTLEPQAPASIESTSTAAPPALRRIVFSIENGTPPNRGVSRRNAAECHPALGLAEPGSEEAEAKDDEDDARWH